MHLPDLRVPPEGPQGVDRVRDACETARRLGCNRVTLHVPGIPARDYAARAPDVLDAYARALAPLAGTDTAIGIENMHMTPGETPDTRGFGYTPDECRAFIDALRALPGLDIGFHLDIGHARNNAPYSSLFPVGTWYEQLGAECNGMHIHQVVQDERGKMLNHKPLLGFFDKLIALSSLVLARQSGLLRPVPMFIEVRDGKGPESLLALRATTML
jgi:sugar phosphate isomerase/epimerase